MSKQDVAVINYAMYEEAKEFICLAQIDLPSLKFMTSVINGAGVAGEIEAVLIGQMQAMEMTIKHILLNKPAIELSTPKIHNWELREVQQSRNTQDGSFEVTGVKHVIRAFPKQMDGGTLKPQSTSDPNTVASVHYWAEYRDGELVMELDPAGFRCFIDGVDYLEKVRAAMGKS